MVDSHRARRRGRRLAVLFGSGALAWYAVAAVAEARDPRPAKNEVLASNAPTPTSRRRRAREGAPPVIRMPSERQERLRWPIAGGVAAVALVAGWFWPRACGYHPVADADETAAASSAEPAPSVEQPPLVAETDAGSEDAAPQPPAVATVTIGKSMLMHCDDPPGPVLKPSKCGDPLLDGIVVQRLEELASCPAATRVVGRLSVTLEIDLVGNVVKVTAGKSSVKKDGRPNDKAIEPLLACLRTSLKDVTTAAEGTGKRDHARYVLSYPVSVAAIGGGATVSSGAVPTEKPAPGTATVTIDAAVVRNGPSLDAPLVGRLTRGTKVTTVGVAGNWYHINFGDDAKSGWIYLHSIGK